jgi:hypothetical protein
MSPISASNRPALAIARLAAGALFLVLALPAAQAGPATSAVPVVYYTFDQGHAGMKPGGNTFTQLRLSDTMGTQDSIVNGPITHFDVKLNGQTYFFDDFPGGGGGGFWGDGLAKFGKALHVRNNGPEGYALFLGDIVATDPNFIVNSTASNVYDVAGNEEWTFEFWYRINEFGTLLAHSDGSNVPRMQFHITNPTQSPAGRLALVLINDDESINPNMFTSGTGYADAQWHHVALVRSVTAGGVDNDFVTLYTDGGSGNGGETVSVLADESGAGFFNWSGNLDTNVNTLAAFWTGRNYVGTPQAIGPEFDDMAFFKAALPPEELGWDSVAWVPPAVTNPPPVLPVVYYNFDQDHSDVALGGNGLTQSPITDFMGLQDSLAIGPFSDFDINFAPQTYFFDDQPGGGSPFGDGLAKFGNALHMRQAGSEGYALFLGDMIASNADYIVSSTTENIYDAGACEEWTLEFWYRVAEPGQTLIGHSDGANVPRLQVRVEPNGTIRADVINNNEGIALPLITTNDIYGSTNVIWHHVAVVRSVEPGAETNDFITLYVDGGEENGGETVQAVASESNTGFINWSDRLHLSADNNGLAAFWAGRNYVGTDQSSGLDLDDFAYWNVARDVSELGFHGPIFAPAVPSFFTGIAESSSMITLNISNLTSGTGYDVEVTEDLICAGCWSNAASFTASSTATNITVPASGAGLEGYRLQEQ